MQPLKFHSGSATFLLIPQQFMQVFSKQKQLCPTETYSFSQDFFAIQQQQLPSGHLQPTCEVKNPPTTVTIVGSLERSALQSFSTQNKTPINLHIPGANSLNALCKGYQSTFSWIEVGEINLTSGKALTRPRKIDIYIAIAIASFQHLLTRERFFCIILSKSDSSRTTSYSYHQSDFQLQATVKESVDAL